MGLPFGHLEADQLVQKKGNDGIEKISNVCQATLKALSRSKDPMPSFAGGQLSFAGTFPARRKTSAIPGA
jgi:hypothetical protein